MPLHNPKVIEYTVNNMRESIHLTAPTTGHYAETFRRAMLLHASTELLACGQVIESDINDASKLVVVGIHGWDWCEDVASKINKAFELGMPIVYVDFEEFL